MIFSIRQLRQLATILRLNSRRMQLQAEISEALQIPIKLDWFPVKVGRRGAIYFAKCQSRNIGAVRLNDPLFEEPDEGRANAYPHYALSPTDRLRHEWDVCSRVHIENLTPRPLWKTRDAAMYAFLDYRPISMQIVSHPDRFWPLMERTFCALHALHSHEIVHLDLNFGNILADENSDKVAFIDFAYAPHESLSRAQQKAFDYLYIITIATRRRRGGRQVAENPTRFAEILDQIVDDETRHADLSFAAKQLAQLDIIPELGASLRAIFKHL